MTETGKQDKMARNVNPLVLVMTNRETRKTSGEAMADALGPRLRELREARGVSGRALASRVGMSSGYISRIENGRVSPTVSTLERIAAALGESMAALFGKVTERDPLVRRAERRISRSRGVVDELLSPLPPGRLEALETTIEGGRGSGPAYTHNGDDEFLHILEGRLRVWLDGHAFELEPGDSLSFACSTPHRWVNPEQGPTRVIWIVTGTPTFSEGRPSSMSSGDSGSH